MVMSPCLPLSIHWRLLAMMIDQWQRTNELCMQIQKEKDQYKFNELVHELNEVIAKRVPLLPFDQMADGA
jgi:hypothetical protein